MRYSLKAVSAACFAAITLATPFVAHASVQPRLGIESVCGQGSHVFNIHNTGTVTTAVLRYQITARAADGMPALKTWNLMLMPLLPSQIFQVNVPQAAWGLKVAVQIVADGAGSQVQVTNDGSKSYPNFCW